MTSSNEQHYIFLHLQVLLQFPVLWLQGDVHILGLFHSSSHEHRPNRGERYDHPSSSWTCQAERFKCTVSHLLFPACVYVLWQMLWVYRTFSTMAELKTLQLKRKARKEKRMKNDWSPHLFPKKGLHPEDLGISANPEFWNGGQIPFGWLQSDASLMPVRSNSLLLFVKEDSVLCSSEGPEDITLYIYFWFS